MKRYNIAYIVLWLPAVLAAFLLDRPEPLFVGLQWGLEILMVLGWAVTTGLAAYRYPQITLAQLFFYTGLTTLTLTVKYIAPCGTDLFFFMERWGGILSYTPLQALVRALQDIPYPQEICAMAVLVAFCLAGYLVGLVYRRVTPDPSRPRFLRH